MRESGFLLYAYSDRLKKKAHATNSKLLSRSTSVTCSLSFSIGTRASFGSLFGSHPTKIAIAIETRHVIEGFGIRLLEATALSTKSVFLVGVLPLLVGLLSPASIEMRLHVVLVLKPTSAAIGSSRFRPFFHRLEMVLFAFGLFRQFVGMRFLGT